MSVRNLKDGSKKPWLCECYPQGREGKRVRKRFATKGEATAYENFIMREVDDKPWMGSKPDNRRLSELLETWWQVHGHTIKSGKVVYRKTALTIKELGDPIASTFTSKQYLAFRASRVSHFNKENKSLSPTYQNFQLNLLSGMFSRLIKYKQWNLPNPLDDIEPIKVNQRALAYLDKADIQPFLQRLGGFESDGRSVSIPEIVLIAKICLATGARISEALSLERSQISEFKLTFVETKGKRIRSVPISENLYKEIMLASSSSTKIFSTTYGSAHRYIKKALPDYVPEGQATHVLRHTFATHFMMNRGDILILQRILGHQKIEQTMAYAHFSPDHLIQAVQLNPLEN
ncbi:MULTISPECIES: site-specific integrase [Vibrio]|uniref:Integrase n=5 Tax=root TaxID=1 RepID=Q9T205_9CAUD|nr:MULTISPECIES: site-specific integrase [Vibrio]NP_536628.1 integrase [Bacteriophage K139]YP_001650866.1 integrase [Vibrio phage Kappa]YP_008766817.1 integrase [Vibrio phage VPUSM 8]HAS4638168.1 site-specific integrase [Vibrio cholerae O1 biovar El Tor str. N16961]AAD22068.1 Int [Bacteriophage K139]ACQ60317.1 integrase [Vibrio cholerae MJ-1236]AGW43540.1 integrase [Vibrio phage VPUSM 8]APF49747.1 Int [Vibrio cholerae]